MTPENWEAAADWFAAGRELSPAEREQLLASCPDEEVRAELRSLWAQEPAQDFLACPVVSSFAALPPTAPPSGNFGPYRVIRLLGEGGMGLVYLAEQVTPINRLVAIKVVKHSLPSAEILRRFEAERQTLALMDHPGIARIYEASTASDGRPYFVMEYVDGLPITSYCDLHRLGYRARLELFRQVCLAVHHAHQKGILHRDLKPSNVLVAVVDGVACPRIIDFGVAKAIESSGADATPITQIGLLLGTPQYMSPEQAAGQSQTLDTTSDVYSLGVLLYEMLVGAAPFDATALRQLGLLAVQQVVLERDPPRPALRLSSLGKSATEVARLRQTDLPSLERILRGDLESILMKALERDRTRRYQSASEFGEDLARHLCNQPVSSTPPSLWYELRKFAARHQRRVVIAAAFLLLILLASAASLLLYSRAEQARAEAVRQADRATLTAAVAGIEDFRSVEARALLETIPPGRRRWEWHFLDWLSDYSLATFDAQEGGREIHTAFQLNGSRFLFSTDSFVHAWDLSSRRAVARYGPFRNIVALSNDGSLVAASLGAPETSAVSVLNAESGARLQRLPHSATVILASFSATAHRLATLDRDGKLAVWDLSTARLLARIAAPRPPVRRPDGVPIDRLTLSPDGSLLAASDLNLLRVYDATSGRLLASVKAHLGPLQELVFDHDGRKLFSASESIRAWDPRTARLLSTWSQTPARPVSALAIHPSLPYVAAACWTQTLQIWDASIDDLATAIPTPALRALRAAAWSPDGRYLISIDNAGVARLWDGPRFGGTVFRRALLEASSTTINAYGKRRSPNEYASMDLHPSSGILALARASTIEWIDSQDGHLIDVHSNLQDSPLRLLRFNPHANRLASASAAGRLCLSSPSKPNPAAPVCADTKREGVLSLAFIDQARRLAVAFSNGILEIREAQTLRLERELRLRAKPIALTANPDGSRLAISYSRDALKPEDSRVDLLDLRTARYTPMQDASRLSRTWFRSLLFHPNGKLLFTGDSGLQGIASWDVGTGQQISSFAGTGRQGSGSRGIALSPDGQTLVSTFGDGALGFWDATSSTPLLQLLRQPSAEIRFSLAGDRLFINTYDAIEVFGTTVSPAHRRPVRFNAAPTSVPRGTGSPL